ncbi:unnamed protein product [Allacma fusca]|uniref:Peptidase S1 domain-containing protein n=1 Tax=Allacma fusca TaxID=39272 RepID=A0A8J2K8A6_9HEXA|nr:unnamed protein product [Allacma fusca]
MTKLKINPEKLALLTTENDFGTDWNLIDNELDKCNIRMKLGHNLKVQEEFLRVSVGTIITGGLDENHNWVKNRMKILMSSGIYWLWGKWDKLRSSPKLRRKLKKYVFQQLSFENSSVHVLFLMVTFGEAIGQILLFLEILTSHWFKHYAAVSVTRLKSWNQGQKLPTWIFLVFLIGKLSEVKGIINFADVPCGKNISVSPFELRYKDTCNVLTRIINGQPVQPGEFPWIVSLKYKWDEHFCGGVIINRRYVLTAAHCFNQEAAGSVKREYLEAVVGATNFETENPALTFGFERVSIHPGYQSRDSSNDLALVRLDAEIPWSDTIRPACFADKYFRPEGSVGVVAGWGETEEGSQMTPSEMNKAKVPIIKNSQCDEWFSRANIKWSPKDTQMCAGYCEGGPDSCKGDSGGPLMVQLENTESKNSVHSVVVGVVAAGKGCGRRRLPGVYTRISHFVQWIHNNVQY